MSETQSSHWTPETWSAAETPKRLTARASLCLFHRFLLCERALVLHFKYLSKPQTLLEAAPYARTTEPVAIRSTSCVTLLEGLVREDVAEPRCNYEWCPSDFVQERALGRAHGEAVRPYLTVTQSVSVTDQRWVPLIGQARLSFF